VSAATDDDLAAAGTSHVAILARQEQPNPGART
jgi:hypothetical protein